MRLIILVLLVLWIHALSKWLAYSSSLAGLLYHIVTTFGEDALPDDRKMKEIRDYALERMVKEILRKYK